MYGKLGPWSLSPKRKLANQTKQKWPDVFQATVWANRITTRKGLGYSPFYLAHGIEPMLPSDLVEATLEPMTKPMSTADLIATRARHLLKHEDDLEDAVDIQTTDTSVIHVLLILFERTSPKEA